MDEGKRRNDQRKIVKNYGVTVTFRLIVVVLTFLNSILINRCLGVALRGEYTTISNWASLLQLFLNLGLGSAYPAIKRRYPEKSKYIYTTLLLLFALGYALLFLVVGMFTGRNVRYTLLIAYMSTVGNLIIFIAIVEDVRKRNLINILTSALHTLILLTIYLLWRRSLYAVLWSIIIDHAVLSIGLILANHVFYVNFRLIDKAILAEIFRIAIPAMIMNLLMYLNYHADVIFLSSLTKDYFAVGLYGTAVTLGNMLWIIPDAFKDILYHRAARRDNPEEIAAAIIVNITLCVIVLTLFTVLGKWFLGFVYGEEFVAAYPLVLLLFVGTLPMVLYKLIHPIYIANGKTRIVVLLLSIAVVANVIGNLILIPLYSATGAAISSVVSYIICGVAFYYKFKYDYHIDLTIILRNMKKILKSGKRCEETEAKIY